MNLRKTGGTHADPDLAGTGKARWNFPNEQIVIDDVASDTLPLFFKATDDETPWDTFEEAIGGATVDLYDFLRVAVREDRPFVVRGARSQGCTRRRARRSACR